jgi:hypothetical protein
VQLVLAPPAAIVRSALPRKARRTPSG